MEKLKNLHLRHSAAQQAFMLRCVRSDCYEALHLKKKLPRGKNPLSHPTANWMVPRASLDAIKKRKPRPAGNRTLIPLEITYINNYRSV
jgi:hypothetical protein